MMARPAVIRPMATVMENRYVPSAHSAAMVSCNWGNSRCPVME